MISFTFRFLSFAIMIYTILCLIDIILTWIPGVKFTSFGKFISTICDPYLDFFAKRGWFRFGNFDFSPILSIGILSLASSILSGINQTGRIFFGGILATIVSMLWSVCNSLISILFLLVLVRWIVLLIHHGETDFNSGWNQLDMFINKFSYKIAKIFVKKPINYQTTLLITWIAFLIVLILGNILINGFLVPLCYQIPF